MRFRTRWVNVVQVAKKLGATAHDIEAGIERAITDAASEGWRVARANAPVFQGAFVNSIVLRPLEVLRTRDRLRIVATVESTSPYGPVLELGRRPGRRWPPEQAIARWVELKFKRGAMTLRTSAGAALSRRTKKGRGSYRKLGQDEERALKTAVFLIRRKIGRTGIPGRHMFRKGAFAARTVFERRMVEEMELATRRFR